MTSTTDTVRLVHENAELRREIEALRAQKAQLANDAQGHYLRAVNLENQLRRIHELSGLAIDASALPGQKAEVA